MPGTGIIVMSDLAIDVKAGTEAKVPPTASPSISLDGSEEATNVALEFPVLLRDLSESSAEQAKENWQVMKSATERLTRMVQGTCTTAAHESMDYGLKVMDLARSNTNDALELASALLRAKAPSEVIELASAHARKRLELVVAQNRQLWAAAQKIAGAMTEPPPPDNAKPPGGGK